MAAPTKAVPIVPAYDSTGLGAVLPGVLRSLGVVTDHPAVDLPPARRVCLVVLDGLGHRLLTEAAAHAPFLAHRHGGREPLSAGCPSTTATSLGSLGTGFPPGRHGLLGYEVRDPDRGVLLNELSWDPAVDPRRWQPEATMFEVLRRHGTAVTSVGNPEFDGSGLTIAALRGGVFVGAKSIEAKVDVAAEQLRAGPGLVYLYIGDIDGAGHTYGWRSPEWTDALTAVDRALARLARMVPRQTLLVLTADHGMVDIPHRNRVDLAEHPELCAGLAVLGGEARFAQAYCHPGAAGMLADRMRGAFGDRAWVLERDQAITAGWFGPVAERNRPRIGDVLVAAHGSFALVDSRTAHPKVLRLIGQHGSLTAAEQLVPLLVESV